MVILLTKFPQSFQYFFLQKNVKPLLRLIATETVEQLTLQSIIVQSEIFTFLLLFQR